MREKNKSLWFDKLGNIPEEFDEWKTDAMLHRVQVSIESTLDIVAMLVKDLGGSVGDDYENVDFLEKERVIGKSLSDYLKKLNGLRSAIVHRYNKFEEESVIINLGEIRNNLFRFMEVVESVVEKVNQGEKNLLKHRNLL